MRGIIGSAQNKAKNMNCESVLIHNDENQEVHDSSDNSDIFDRYDRMDDTHVMEEEDIVDVSVDRGEDQDFGLNVNERDNIPSSAEDEILNNPYLEQLLKRMVDDKVEKTLEMERKKDNEKRKSAGEIVKNRCDKFTNITLAKNTDRRVVVNKRCENNIPSVRRDGDRLIKSPSDTTLYAPALKQNLGQRALFNQPTLDLDGLIHDHDHRGENTATAVTGAIAQQQQSNDLVLNDQIVNNGNLGSEIQMIDKISDFVEGIRISTAANAKKSNLMEEDAGPSTSTGFRGAAAEDTFMDERDKLTQARTRANRLILEAEQYKAKVETPKGMSDDEFFHISCHIDPNIKIKIENGEYIELEKLLPKSGIEHDGDDRMELVNRDGQMYFVSASNKDNKIRNVRRWEQAFRVYAAIYSAANPHRSHEIWQYVYVINSAASCYVWEEVAQYDYMFRQLMSRNPGRSWAVTYTQMWQMTLRHVLVKGGNGNGGQNSQNSYSNYTQQQSGNGQGKKKEILLEVQQRKMYRPGLQIPTQMFLL